jgi:hypothetical protein
MLYFPCARVAQDLGGEYGGLHRGALLASIVISYALWSPCPSSLLMKEPIDD